MTKHSKKNICYICYRRFPDTNFENYSQAVSESGYDVTIISYQDKDQKASETRDNRKIMRIPLHEHSSKRKRALIFILKIVEILNKNHFSIVHIHHTCPYFFLAKILTLRKAKYIYHTTSYPISTTRSMKYKQMLKNFVQCLFMDKIIIQSEELRLKLIGIRSLKKTEVVPVGFNKNCYYPFDKIQKNQFRKLLNIHEDHSLLVYCGIIAYLRQLDRLLEGFRKIQKIFPDVKLLMVGDGNALEDLKELAVALGVSKSVVFTGRVPNHEVVNYIAIADIGISYIPINENFNYNPPLKTFEYLACGLPTIATKTESNSKIITDGFNGILVDDTPDDLADRIIKLLTDKGLQKHLSQNARNGIMEFDFGYITQNKLIPLYEELLQTGLNNNH